MCQTDTCFVRLLTTKTVGFLKAMQEADDDDLALRKEELSKKLKPQTQQIAEYLATRHKLRYFDEPL